MKAIFTEQEIYTLNLAINYLRGIKSCWITKFIPRRLLHAPISAIFILGMVEGKKCAMTDEQLDRIEKLKKECKEEIDNTTKVLEEILRDGGYNKVEDDEKIH